jgi:hypothetical protein
MKEGDAGLPEVGDSARALGIRPGIEVPATDPDDFEKARQFLREADREKDEDAVMDVMDFLLGWCSPHMQLPPDPPSPSADRGVTNGAVLPPTPKKARDG